MSCSEHSDIRVAASSPLCDKIIVFTKASSLHSITTKQWSEHSGKAYSSSCPQAGTHRSTNWARRRVTSFQSKRFTNYATPPTNGKWLVALQWVSFRELYTIFNIERLCVCPVPVDLDVRVKGLLLASLFAVVSLNKTCSLSVLWGQRGVACSYFWEGACVFVRHALCDERIVLRGIAVMQI